MGIVSRLVEVVFERTDLGNGYNIDRFSEEIDLLALFRFVCVVMCIVSNSTVPLPGLVCYPEPVILLRLKTQDFKTQDPFLH